MSFILTVKMIGQKNSPVAHQNLLDLPMLYLHWDVFLRLYIHESSGMSSNVVSMVDHAKGLRKVKQKLYICISA